MPSLWRRLKEALTGGPDRAPARREPETKAVESEWRIFRKPGAKVVHYGEVEHLWQSSNGADVVAYAGCGYVAHGPLDFGPVLGDQTMCKRCAAKQLKRAISA